MPGEDANLSITVLELLQSNNVVVKTSVEVLLRHTIESTIGAYDSKLRTSKQMICELCSRIHSLEKDLEVRYNSGDKGQA